MLSTLILRSFSTFRGRRQLVKILSLALESNAKCSSQRRDWPKRVFKNNSSLPKYRDTPFGSQYHPLSPIENADSMIKEYISENNPRTFDEWQDAKDSLYTEIELLSDVNYSSIVMNILLYMNDIDAAQAFIKYLEKSNLKPNYLTYLQYMALCGKNVEKCGQEVILETFKKVQHVIDAMPVLDLKRTIYIIQGLCSTDRWQEAFGYLKKIPYSPTLDMKNSLASAAIRNGDETLAWEIVTKWLKNGEILGNQVIKEFLKYANVLQLKDKRKAVNFILKLFQLMGKNGVIVNEEGVKLIAKFFKGHSSKWNMCYTKVSRVGECDGCRKSLKDVELSDQEFIYLKDSFLEKSVKKKDIFINTTLEEFHKYIAFIERHKPFHIVIDGLNVAYSTQKPKTARNLASHLLNVVERLSGGSRRVLVLGRKHMASWPKYLTTKITKRAALFLANNISQDDPFTLYAALASGPHTYILTKDLMRDHISRLEDTNLIHLFKKWQQSHQIFMTVDENNGLKFTDPVRHSITIQGSMESGWHIPFDDNILLDPYEELNNWLCIRKMDT